VANATPKGNEMTDKQEVTATTPEEVAAAGFVGTTNSYPNEFHEASGEAEDKRAEVFGFPAAGSDEPPAVPSEGATEEGASINGPDEQHPVPTGGVSGPGAGTDTSNDDTNTAGQG